MNSNLYDRIHGTLAGAFIGLLFARATGKSTYKDHPRVDDIPNDKVPMFSDMDYLWVDNLKCKHADGLAIMRIFVDTYAKRNGRITVEDLRDEWVAADIPADNHYMMANNLREVLMQGMPPRLAGAFGCFTSYSTAWTIPIGVFNAFDSDGAFHDGEQLGSMSMKDPALSISAALCACVAEAMKPSSTVESLVGIADRFVPNKEYILWDDRLPNNPKAVFDQAMEVARTHDSPQGAFDDLTRLIVPEYHDDRYKAQINDHIIPMGLSAAFVLLGKGDFRESMLGAVNFAAYAYLTTSMVGAMVGALSGASGIPREWLSVADEVTDGGLRSMADVMMNVLDARFARSREQVQYVQSLA
jgi:hypothetical protein